MKELASYIIRPRFRVFSAAVILDDENRVLLVKTTYNRFHPWGLPGGSLEYGEEADVAAVREVWEETSLKVDIERLVYIKSLLPDRFGLFYLCNIVSGGFHPSDEVSEYGYFSPDALPDVHPVDVEVIKQIYAEILK